MTWRMNWRVWSSALLFVGAMMAPALPQGRSGDTGGHAVDLLLRSANRWDANGDQVYSCDEWKRYVGDMFTKADRNRDGFVDAQEFRAIQEADPQFKDAGLGYFDDNRDGKLSRSEFVDKPSPFFLRFDLNRDCKVTLDEVMEQVGRESDSSKPRRLPSR